MILVFGGTTEGKQVISVLADMDHRFWYSSKTEISIDLPPNGQYRHGAFTSETLTDFCRQQAIGLIIHASHPFATELHRTIEEAASRTGICVVRQEREYPARVEHPLIHYTPGYPELLLALEDERFWLQTSPPEPVLALTGVQSIARLQSYWQRHRMLFRILPRDSSLAIARETGFPEKDLLLSLPATTVGGELAFIRSTGAQAILTKESGESGFLSVKITAAIAAGIPLFIVCRPPLPPGFIKVHGPDALIREIKKIPAWI
jgi:precorrin-6A/cobalt-precorrin-6A reductase